MDTALLKGTLSLLILSLLSRKVMYGYELAETVHSDSDGAFTWRAGSLYPSLHKLEQDGLIVGEWEEKESGAKASVLSHHQARAGRARRKAAVVGRLVYRGQSHPGQVPWIDSIDTSIRLCWSIGGPKCEAREYVRQALRGAISSTPWSSTRRQGFPLRRRSPRRWRRSSAGLKRDLRPELEATHGHRMLAVLIDRAAAMRKERTMRAKWLWSSWAYLTLSLLIALELLFVVFNLYFIYPKFSGLLAAGLIDGEFLRKPGGSWMPTFLERLETVEQKYGWSILLAAAAAIGLFE